MFKELYRERRLTSKTCVILNIVLVIIGVLNTIFSITGNDNTYFMRIHSIISIYSFVNNLAILIVIIFERINLKDTTLVKSYWKRTLPDYSSGIMIVAIILSFISIVMSFLKIIF